MVRKKTTGYMLSKMNWLIGRNCKLSVTNTFLILNYVVFIITLLSVCLKNIHFHVELFHCVCYIINAYSAPYL